MQIKVTLKGEEIGTFDDEGMTIQDAFALKAASGLNLKPFFEGLNEMDPLSLQTLVWFLRHKKGDQAHISEVDFIIADLGMEKIDPPAEPAEIVETSAGNETTPSAS